MTICARLGRAQLHVHDPGSQPREKRAEAQRVAREPIALRQGERSTQVQPSDSRLQLFARQSWRVKLGGVAVDLK
jgi:hypothetical protein